MSQAVVQQGMNAMHHTDAQALVLQFDVLITLHSAVLLQVVVEFPDLDGGQFFQWNISEARDDVLVDIVQIVVFGFLPKPRLGVYLVPHFYPTLHCVGAASVHVQPLAVCDGLFQLFFYFTLRLT